MTPYCPSCLEPFQSQGLFDDHRVGAHNADEENNINPRTGQRLGPRRCLTPAEMTARGWRRGPHSWHGEAMTPEQKARFRKTQEEQ